MAMTKEGNPIPCGGCPGGYFCVGIAEENSISLWEMPTIEGQLLYGCEFVDKDGARTTPTIVTLGREGYFAAPTSGAIAQSRLFDKYRIADRSVHDLMLEVGELCLERMKACPGARRDYSRAPFPDICPAGLGQLSVEFFVSRLNLARSRHPETHGSSG